MAIRYRIILLGSMLMVLVGCSSRAFGGELEEVEAISDTALVRTMQYLEADSEGPVYDVSMTVPENWVGNFETRVNGNRITFEYLIVDEEAVAEAEANEEEPPDPRRAAIFYIEALSREQYWEQVGSYPGDYPNIQFTADTFFIYHVPQFAFYSGLSDEDYEAWTADVPDIITSVSTRRVN